MKTKFIFWNLFLSLAFFSIAYTAFDMYNYYRLVNRIEAINLRINYLHNEEGYTIESAKHITDVEFGIIPADAYYQALMED